MPFEGFSGAEIYKTETLKEIAPLSVDLEKLKNSPCDERIKEFIGQLDSAQKEYLDKALNQLGESFVSLSTIESDAVQSAIETLGGLLGATDPHEKKAQLAKLDDILNS